MRHTKIPFGNLPDGSVHYAHVLENGAGMRATVLEYGAILKSLIVPDRAGQPVNVVHGLNTLDAYLAGGKFASAVIGRVANRISGAAFTVDGIQYTLEKNSGDLNIHSGSGRYGWRFFQAEDSSDATCAAVTLRVFDGGEGGMPGTVAFSVRYSLGEQNALRLEYRATPSQKTPISVTSHAYFNLNGRDGADVENHLLMVNADYYLPNDATGLPTGEVLSVAGTRFDLREPSRLADCLSPEGRGFDNNFCIRGRGMREVAAAYAPTTGIRMRAVSDMPGMQLLARAQIFCFETQHYPNAVNYSHFPCNLYTPERPFLSETTFLFDTVAP